MGSRKGTIIIFILIILTVGLLAIYLYRKNNKKVDAKKGNPKMLFIGDSFTVGTNSYVDQLVTRYPNIQATKIAKVGATTDWMVLNAMDSIRFGGYDTIFILGGVNDIYARNATAQAKLNLQQLYDAGKASGAKVIAITIAPSDNYASYDDYKGSLTADLNDWIKNNQTPDYIIDFNSRLRLNDGSQDTSFFEPDRLHANTEGHELLTNEIDKTVFK